MVEMSHCEIFKKQETQETYFKSFPFKLLYSLEFTHKV